MSKDYTISKGATPLMGYSMLCGQRLQMPLVGLLLCCFWGKVLHPQSRHHMLCFVMYDIQNNKVRKHVADYLESKGLKRIQLSVFFGELDRKVYKLVHETLLDIQVSYVNTDSLMMVPVSEDEVKSMKLIGKEVDFEFAIIRGNTMFF